MGCPLLQLRPRGTAQGVALLEHVRHAPRPGCDHCHLAGSAISRRLVGDWSLSRSVIFGVGLYVQYLQYVRLCLVCAFAKREWMLGPAHDAYGTLLTLSHRHYHHPHAGGHFFTSFPT